MISRGALSREEWEKHLRDQQKPGGERRAQRGHAIALARAEVKADRLASGDEWQLYQEMVSGLADQTRTELERIGPQLLDPECVEHAALLKVKLRGQVLHDRLRTLEVLLDLPKRVQEDGEAAREWLREQRWSTEEPTSS